MAEQTGKTGNALLDGLYRWALARSGEPELARVLRLLTAAAQEGHLGLRCTDELLHTPNGAVPVDLAALQRSGWLSASPQHPPAPLLLEQQRLYIWRHRQAELRVATQLAARALKAGPALPQPLPAELLPAAAAPGEPGADQTAAVRAAGLRGLQVLTGGPGTGKTTTVIRLLLAVLSRTTQLASTPLRIALAAPTGKAAQRLAQAVLHGATQLRPQLSPAMRLCLDRLPGDASTLHTLLGYHPQADRFMRDADDPLALDVLVVDEASMVDLELMDALLQALPESALLILVGDPDQLVSVAAGTVLADLVAAAKHNPALQPVLSRLEHVWRARDALVELPRAVRAGDPAAVQQQLQAGAAALQWTVVDEAARLPSLQQQWLQQHQEHYRALAAVGLDPAQALQQVARLQLLCAVRQGPFGMHAFNAVIAEQMRRWADAAADSRWYRGRVVMVTHNHHALKLYNGDIGITLADPDGELAVWFGDLGDGQPRRFQPRQLSDHEEAWAITVHKAQGSEYAAVLLVLPPDPEHRLLSRELLYTGMTRARSSFSLWASAPALRAAIERPAWRSGGLRQRLQQTSG